MYDYFLGIDISKDTFDCCLLDLDSKQLFKSKEQMEHSGFKNIDDKLQSLDSKKVLIIMESTGIYHLTILSFLLEQKYSVIVANPLLISNYIKSDTLRKSKTDEKDAFSIADYGLSKHRKLRLVSNDFLDSLRPVIRERETITSNAARLKTDIKAVLTILFPELLTNINVFTKSNLLVLKVLPSARFIKKFNIKKLTKVMNKASANKSKIDPQLLLELALKSIGIKSQSYEIVLISKIERLLELMKVLREFDNILDAEINEENNEDFKILKSISGIGDVTAKTLLVEIINIDNFSSSNQLTAFFGTDPAVKQSGTSIKVRGKITKRGNAHLRRIIWIMAVCVIRNNTRFNDYFRKKRNQGMAYKKAVIATANKLIRTIFGMLKNRTEFVLE